MTEPPCVGRPWAYDIIIDGHGPLYTYAVNEAAAMCAGCPIRSRCLTANADEEWAQVITRARVRRCAGCGAVMRLTEKSVKLGRRYCGDTCNQRARRERVAA